MDVGVRRAWILLLTGVLDYVSVCVHGAPCTDRDVKYMLNHCNPQLAAISSAILATTDNNYTDTCRSFEAYIVCTEPNVEGCRSLLMEPYWRDRTIYRGPPYNCRLPDITRQQKAQSLYAYKTRSSPESAKAASSIQSSLHSSSLVSVFVSGWQPRTLFSVFLLYIFTMLIATW